MRRLCFPAFLVIVALAWVAPAGAGDLRITIPKRSKPTPVQQLNRDGVKAVQKHEYEKARRLFYKAYLLDPNDPFTLNNLGYISELEGEVDRAQRYYALSADMASEALVDRASSQGVEGKPVAAVAGKGEEKSLQVNRLNVEAMALLLKDRAPEAEFVLGRALALDIKNPFTLNNIGFAREQEGEMESAISYYTAAANTRSREPIVVTVNGDWRGKSISEVAARNAHKVRQAMEDQGDHASEVSRLNLRGVAALNRNDRRTAREDFQRAYKLDPNNAFTLNNMGYLAELDGDRETAQFYYSKAREADEAHAKVGLATRAEFKGKPVMEVADFGNEKVQAKMDSDLMAKRRQGGAIQLKRRDGSAVLEPAAPARPRLPSSDQPQYQPPSNQQQILPPLPESQQPPETQNQPPKPPQ